MRLPAHTSRSAFQASASAVALIVAASSLIGACQKISDDSLAKKSDASCQVGECEFTSGNAPDTGSASAFLIVPPTGTLSASQPYKIEWSNDPRAVFYELSVSTDAMCSLLTVPVARLTQQFSSLTVPTAGSLYICMEAIDADGARWPADNSPLAITVGAAAAANTAPTMTLLTPNADANLAGQTQGFLITWNDFDPDDDAKIRLYTSLTLTDDCTAGDLLVADLSENAGGKTGQYRWVTADVRPGTYYICALITDSINQPVSTWAPSSLTINSAPTLTFTAPGVSPQTIALGDEFNIVWTDDDPDSNASIQLYYLQSAAGVCSQGTPIGSSLSENADGMGDRFAWNTAGVAPGSYYICAVLNDGLNQVEVRASGALTLNKPATITLIEPDGFNDQVPQTARFNITWSDSDPDDDAKISLFYALTTTGECSSAPLIVSDISENSGGTSGAYAWDSTLVPKGSYYICARISDGHGQSQDNWSTGALSLNAAPIVTVSTPAVTQTIAVGSDLSLSWTASDEDDTAAVTIGYSTTASGPCPNTFASYSSSVTPKNAVWDTTSVAPNSYYLCVSADDSVNSRKISFSANVVVYDPAVCTWIGAVSTDWQSAANWVGCNDGVPTASDSVLIARARSNQPTITTADVVIEKFGAGVSDGIVTLANGRSLTINNNIASIGSSTTILSQTSSCTTCVLRAGNDSLSVVNNATLTVGPGIRVEFNNSGSLNVGTVASRGHLVVAGGSTAAQWPVFTSTATYWKGIRVQSSSNSSLSKVTIQGLRLDKIQGDGNTWGLDLISNFVLFNLSDIVITHHSTVTSGGGIRLQQCKDSNFDTDFSIRALEFSSVLDGGHNIDMANVGCGGVTLTLNGKGAGYGAAFEVDPGNRLSWSQCTWTGASNRSWSNPTNWSNCNSAYPGASDWVNILATTNGPLITSATSIQGIATGNDGGTITIAAGQAFTVNSPVQTVQGQIIFVGESESCTSCKLVAGGGSLVITLNGELELQSGLTLQMGDGGRLYVGTAATPGRFVASGSAGHWPRITAPTSWNGLVIQSPGSIRSYLSVGGLAFQNVASSAWAVDLVAKYQVNAINGLSIAHAAAVDGGGIRIQDCSNGLIPSDLTELTFTSAISTGSNIDTDNASCSVFHSIGISGSGLGYGSSYHNDPYGLLTWQ